jgi:hypothetical protein
MNQKQVLFFVLILLLGLLISNYNTKQTIRPLSDSEVKIDYLTKRSNKSFRPAWRSLITLLLSEIFRQTRNDKNIGLLTFYETINNDSHVLVPFSQREQMKLIYPNFRGFFLQYPYLVAVIPHNGFETELRLALNPPNFSNHFLNLVQGLGTVAKFNSFTSTVIDCNSLKQSGINNYFPSQEWYDEYNGFFVALKDEKANGSKCYLFGFLL